MRWRQAAANAVLGSPDSDEWIINTLEAELNAAGGDVLALPQLAAKHGFRVVQIAAAPNLFSDGAEASVVHLATRFTEFDGLYLAGHAVAPQQVELKLIRSHWRFDGGNDHLPPPSDLNSDGQPEVTLVIGAASGSMCVGQLEIYQWQADHFADLATGPANPYGIPLTECSASWEYTQPTGAGRALLETHIFNFVYNITRRYVWESQGYALAAAYPEPDAYFSEFEATWRSSAWETGDYAGIATQLQPRIAQAAPPASGPAYSAYLLFQLGLTKAFQNDRAALQADLHDVISATRGLTTPALAVAAQSYLDAYTGPADLYRACDHAQAAMQAALAAQPADAPNPQLAAWGYSLGPTVDDDVCSLRAAFLAVVRQWTPADLTDAPAQLQAAGVRMGAAEQFNLDPNDTLEWIVIISANKASQPWEPWVLAGDANGVRAVPAMAWEDQLWNDTDIRSPLQPVITQLDLPGAVQPVVLVNLGDWLQAFRLIAVADTLRAVSVLPPSYGVTDYHLQPVGATVDLVPADAQGFTYRWDLARQAFDWVATPTPTPLQAAEALLFDPGRRAEAEAIYAAALAALPEADQYMRPRMLYGQAVAAELDGDETRAAALFWQVWHDHPGSIYGFIGRERLELVP